MVSARVLIAVTIGVVIGVSMIPTVIGVTDNNAGTVTETNESVSGSVELDTWYELQGYEVVSGSETVYFENGTAGSFEVASSSTDYDLNTSDGAIKLLSTGEVDAGDEVKMTYDYQATDSTTETVVDLFGLLIALVILVAISNPIREAM